MRYQFAVLLFCTLFAYLSAQGSTGPGAGSGTLATYGVPIPVTSTETSYIFHSATSLTTAVLYPVVVFTVVDSEIQPNSNAEVNVSAITIIPSTSSAVPSYPVGYSSLAQINGLEGFRIDFIGDQFASENYTGLTASLTIPVPANYTPPSLDPSTTSVQPHYALLYFNPGTNNYGVVPQSDITDLGKSLRVIIRQSILLLYVLYNPLVPPMAFNSTHNATGASFITTAGGAPANITLESSGQRILTLLNFTGSVSGVLTVGIVSVPKEISAVPRLRRLISSVFNFTHSGSNNVSTTLAFDFSQLNLDQHEIDSLSWYKFNTVTSSWDLKGGVIIGGNITFKTTSFSDWSVQSNVSSSSYEETSSNGNTGSKGNSNGNTPSSSSTLSSFLSLLLF